MRAEASKNRVVEPRSVSSLWGSVTMRVGFVLALLSALAAGIGSVQAQPATSSFSQQKLSSFMRVFGPAQPPYGFVQFCDTDPRHCAPTGIEEDRFQATPERLSQLDEINRLVNDHIKPQTDLEIYGVSERWTLPTTTGDCEDYALLKRKMLIDLGWPQSALLLTVVRDELGEGHAILTARTAQGDFVLDNKIQQVRIWNATPYEYVMRQSYVNPKVWVSLDKAYTDAPTVMAGSNSR